MKEGINSFRFADVCEAFHTFWFNSFCDFFLEYTKYVDRSDLKALNSLRHTMLIVLERSMRLLHPLMPFISEDLYQKLPQFEQKSESISIASYPEII